MRCDVDFATMNVSHELGFPFDVISEEAIDWFCFEEKSCCSSAKEKRLLTMDPLIDQVAGKIGIEPKVAKQGLGALLRFLKEHSAQDLFQKLLSIEGVDALVREPEAEAAVRDSPKGTGGLIGLVLSVLKTFGVLTILKQLATTIPVFGTKAVQLIEGVEDGAELTVVLQRIGVDRGQGIKMVQMLVDFVKEKLDPQTIEKIAAQVPAVKAFLGESKKDE